MLASSYSEQMKDIQKECVYNAFLDLLMKDIVQGVCDIRYENVYFNDRESSKSFWFYKDGKHHIAIRRLTIPTPYSEEDCREIYPQDVAHEIGHSLYTNTDFKQTQVLLNRGFLGMYGREPSRGKHLFDVYNIVEDVRVEALMTQNFGIKFLTNITEVEEFFPKSPEKIPQDSLLEKFWYLRCHPDLTQETEIVKRECIEGSLEHRTALLEAKLWSKAFDLITECRDKATTYERTVEIALILSENIDNERDNLPFSWGDMVAPEYTQDYEKRFDRLETVMQKEKISHVDLEGLEEQARILKKIFKSNCVNDSTEQPSRRIDIRNYGLKQYDRLYVNKTLLGNSDASVHVCLDCSGSMFGTPMDNAKKLIKILSLLTRKGYIKGFLSTSSSGDYHIYKFPLTDEEINNIKADGDEGFKKNFPKFTKVAKTSKYTFLFSDGEVVDEKIDQTDLNQLGVKIIGLYVGSEGNSQGLRELLKEVIVAPDIEALVYELVKKVRN